jgi:COMM domain containing 3
VSKYVSTRNALRKQLAMTLFHPPKVVDVDWRLDYFLKANAVEKINIPIYRIVFQV